VLEVLAAVVLGFAVLAIAWGSMQSALWGGTQDSATTQSVLLSNEANDLFQQADGIKTLDQILFVEYLVACVGEQDDSTDFVCEQIIANLSVPGSAALDSWSDNDDQFLVFETDEYLDALYGEAAEASAESQTQFEVAVQANTNGDRYETASSALATVLFFAGISLVISSTLVRRMLLAAATLALIAAGGYLLLLPVG
jgi:hypothetical protein